MAAAILLAGVSNSLFAGDEFKRATVKCRSPRALETPACACALPAAPTD
jgi:hypothetical protein